MADNRRRLTLAEVVDRIEALSVPEPNCGCLLWDGNCVARMPGDKRPKYGMIRLRGKMTKVHRVMYEAAYGPIPNGLHVLHKCDVSLCCNPAHLFVGTNDDNHADKALKDRGRKRLTSEKARKIFLMKRAGMSQPSIARHFNVNQSTVSRILTGIRRASLGLSATS